MKNIIIGIVVLVVAILGFVSFRSKPAEVVVKVDKMMKADTVMMEKNGEVGSYEAYAPQKIALAETNKVVLFFHAPWCPYCRGTDMDINKNLSAMPKGVIILKTDYDTNVPLRQKYGVTYQHTFVQIDKDGNLIKKWAGSEGLSDVLEKIQK